MASVGESEPKTSGNGKIAAGRRSFHPPDAPRKAALRVLFVLHGEATRVENPPSHARRLGVNERTNSHCPWDPPRELYERSEEREEINSTLTRSLPTFVLGFLEGAILR